MLKSESLRQHLLDAVPDLARDPDRLLIFLKEGSVAATAVPSRLAFEYAYRLTVLVTDFGGHPDSLFVPVMEWVSRYQPDLLGNPDRRGQITFEAEVLSNRSVDLEIVIPLTEAVAVTPRPDGNGWGVKHFAEPDAERLLPAGRWDVYLRDEYLGGWDVEA